MLPAQSLQFPKLPTTCLNLAPFPMQPPPGHSLASLGMLQSVGIFAVSVSGHSTLPSLRAAMRKPALFPRVLTITFSVMMVFYMALAAAG